MTANDIKHINSLKIKKYRYNNLEFFAEGEKVITELINEVLILKKLYLLKEVESQFINHNYEIISQSEMKKISNLQTPSTCLAVFKMVQNEIKIDTKNWFLVLDDIQDPGNLGTIIRTADWFGIHNIFCSNGCVDAYNPKVVQATMASIARVNIVETNLETLFEEYSEMPIYGALLNGTDIRKQNFDTKGFILIGNEGHGIHKNLISKINYPITIAKNGKTESLNAAIATAIILHQIF